MGSTWALESPQVGFIAWMMMSYVALRMSHQLDKRLSVLTNNANLSAPSRTDPAGSRPSGASASFVIHHCLFNEDRTPRPHGTMRDSQRGPGLSVASMGIPRNAPMISSAYVSEAVSSERGVHSVEAQPHTMVVQKEDVRTSPCQGSDKLQAPPAPLAQLFLDQLICSLRTSSEALRGMSLVGEMRCRAVRVGKEPLSKEPILSRAPTKRDGS